MVVPPSPAKMFIVNSEGFLGEAPGTGGTFTINVPTEDTCGFCVTSEGTYMKVIVHVNPGAKGSPPMGNLILIHDHNLVLYLSARL